MTYDNSYRPPHVSRVGSTIFIYAVLFAFVVLLAAIAI